MISAGEKVPSLNYPEIDPYFEKLKVEGIFLEAHEIADVQKTLKILLEWGKFLRSKNEEYIEIAELGKNLHVEKSLIDQIDLCIDEKGGVRANASPELRKIRNEMQKKELAARKTLEKVMRDARKSGMAPDDSSLTIRNGRLVIPLKSEYKRQLKGFMHDASATGNIIFVEPAEVLEINNDVKELSYREKREIIRILTDLTDQIRDHKDPLMHGSNFLGIIDLIKSKAQFTIQFDSILPEISKERKLDWRNAINPILKKALDKQGKEIVPLNVNLDRSNRILIISGPNAGGKSVCLQTVGLLQYMFQCGIPIPVLEGATLPIFKDIFIDIGDEQSIEDDLSTYSSHLRSMDRLIKNAGKGTLFLIDEFGSGTDPQFGGAIAEAMLEELAESGAEGIITTHYNNLKKIADAKEGLINGRMRFDVKKLEPLYQLEIGKPGSSFALEIAGKIGLPRPLIKSAKKKVGTDAVELDRLLTELEEEKKTFEEQSKKFKDQNDLLEKTIRNYKELQSDIDIRKKEILNEAKHEAKKILKDTNQKVENLIREIRENKAEKKQTKQSREEVSKFEKSIRIEKVEKKEKKVKVISGEIQAGDLVRIKGQDSVGEVMKIGKQDAEVTFGDLKSKIKLGRLERISKGAQKKLQKASASALKGINLNERKANFYEDLDVRGKRAEEAINLLMQFMDNAILFGSASVRIVHGKGDGILRQVLREQLRSFREVDSFHDEHADRGGAGITVIKFK